MSDFEIEVPRVAYGLLIGLFVSISFWVALAWLVTR